MMTIPSFMLFLMMYSLSFMYVLNIDDWIMIWLGLELNMMSYIALIYKKYDKHILESCLKYFLIQSLGSALLLVSFFLFNIMCMLIVMLLSYKLGAGPFFFWFPSVCSGLGWLACYVLMTFQKIMPLFLISGFLSWIMWYVIILSLILGALGSFNQVNMKSLFAYSSIHHIGWLISCLFSNDLFWLWYLFIYSMMLFSLIFYLMLYDINNFYMLGKCKNKMWFMVGFMSLAGLPPLLGFFLKWVAFLYILSTNYIYVMFLLLMSVIMLYIYLRVVYDSLLMNNISMSWSYNFDELLMLIKVDYFNFFGLFLGMMIGFILIV